MKKVTNKKVENLNSLEKRLTDSRTRLNMSQNDLANKTFLSRTQINYYETGTRKPDIDKLKSIADVLNVSIDYLLCRTNNRDISNTNISQKTGLSDESINKLNQFTEKDGYQKDILYGEHYNFQDFFIIINKIIENDKFESLIHFIRAYINSFRICELEKEIMIKQYQELDINVENNKNSYDISNTDIYKFKVNDIFSDIVNEVMHQLKDSFSERWILNEDHTKILKKCKDGSEEIQMLKKYGGEKDNGSSRTNKK